MQIPTWIRILRSQRCEKLCSALAHALQAYFRVEIEGIEHIPKNGPVIILPNHSGFAGLDAVVLAHVISSKAGRDFRILAHQAYFEWSRSLRIASRNFGLSQANFWSGITSLEAGKVLILFPEGEQGNFKPSSKRYHLQNFHSGFLRLAAQSNASIIPCLVIGAEESHWNLATLDLRRWIPNLILPLPLNFFPLPAKWKISFLKPIQLTAEDKIKLQSKDSLRKRSGEIRDLMQSALNLETARRRFIYFPLPKKKQSFRTLGVNF